MAEIMNRLYFNFYLDLQFNCLEDGLFPRLLFIDLSTVTKVFSGNRHMDSTQMNKNQRDKIEISEIIF